MSLIPWWCSWDFGRKGRNTRIKFRVSRHFYENFIPFSIVSFFFSFFIFVFSRRWIWFEQIASQSSPSRPKSSSSSPSPGRSAQIAAGRSTPLPTAQAQTQSQTENAVHHPTIDGPGEEIQRETIPVHCRTGWIFRFLVLDRNASENLVPKSTGQSQTSPRSRTGKIADDVARTSRTSHVTTQRRCIRPIRSRCHVGTLRTTGRWTGRSTQFFQRR